MCCSTFRYDDRTGSSALRGSNDRTKVVRVLATDFKDISGFTLVGATTIKTALTPSEYLMLWLGNGSVNATHEHLNDLIPLDEVVHTLWFKDAKLGWRTWGMVWETKTPDVELELASLKQSCRYSAGSTVQMHVTTVTLPSEAK